MFICCLFFVFIGSLLKVIWSPAFDESYRTPMELYKRVRANYVKSVDAVDPEEAEVATKASGLLQWLAWPFPLLLQTTRHRVYS